MILYDQNIWGGTDKPMGNRPLLIKDMIYRFSADVLCIQECNPATMRVCENAFPDIIKADYEEIITEGDPHHTTLFYRPATVELIASGRHTYSGKNFGNAYAAAWAVLSEKASGKKFGLLSTHFWFKGIDETDSNQRLENARELCAVVRDIENRYGVPVLMAGDFNCGAGSHQGIGGYQEMTRQGMRDVRYLAESTTDSHTIHNYPIHNADQVYVNADRPYRTLDYVFVNGADDISLKKFHVETGREALLSSDHCPLVVEFYLK